MLILSQNRRKSSLFFCMILVVYAHFNPKSSKIYRVIILRDSRCILPTTYRPCDFFIRCYTAVSFLSKSVFGLRRTCLDLPNWGAVLEKSWCTSIISLSFFFFLLLLTLLLFQLLDKPWSQVSSLLPPGSCLTIFITRIGFSNPTARRFFIECCWLTLSRFPQVKFVHKKKSQRIHTSMHSAGLDLTKLTYTRLEDNLTRRRGYHAVARRSDIFCLSCESRKKLRHKGRILMPSPLDVLYKRADACTLKNITFEYYNKERIYTRQTQEEEKEKKSPS